MQWLNNHATVPLCVAIKQAPHAINVIWNDSQSDRPLWCGRYEIQSEDLQEILWRCNPWTIEVHGYWKTKQLYLDQTYIFMAMKKTNLQQYRYVPVNDVHCWNVNVPPLRESQSCLVTTSYVGASRRVANCRLEMFTLFILNKKQHIWIPLFYGCH